MSHRCRFRPLGKLSCCCDAGDAGDVTDADDADVRRLLDSMKKKFRPFFFFEWEDPSTNGFFLEMSLNAMRPEMILGTPISVKNGTKTRETADDWKQWRRLATNYFSGSLSMSRR